VLVINLYVKSSAVFSDSQFINLVRSDCLAFDLRGKPTLLLFVELGNINVDVAAAKKAIKASVLIGCIVLQKNTL